MKTLKFKTTIKCNGCVETVAPKLNALKEITHWEVDLDNQNKILTITGENIAAEQIQKVLTEIGYKADAL